MAKYKVSFIFDDTNADFSVDEFINVTVRDASEVGQVITDVQIEEIK